MTGTQNIFTFAATGLTPPTNPKQPITENGFVRMLIIETPNFSNAVTTTIRIRDKRGYLLWSVDSIAANLIGDSAHRIDDASTPSLPHIPLEMGYTMEAIINGVAGTGGGAVNVMMYVSRNKP